MLFERRHRERKELNIIPLINVIFLLLIFFLVTGSINPQEPFPVDVPISDTAEERHHEEPMHILLGVDGAIYINKVAVTERVLMQTLYVRLKIFPEQVVIIKADSTLPARRLVEVMRLVSEAGGINLSLATQKAES